MAIETLSVAKPNELESENKFPVEFYFSLANTNPMLLCHVQKTKVLLTLSDSTPGDKFTILHEAWATSGVRTLQKYVELLSYQVNDSVCPGMWFREYFCHSFRADENVSSPRGLEGVCTDQTVKATISDPFIY